MPDVSISSPVPQGLATEVQLMASLAQIIASFKQCGPYMVIADDEEIARAVDWLHAKYGSKGNG
jgi:hypothetical protein